MNNYDIIIIGALVHNFFELGCQKIQYIESLGKFNKMVDELVY